MGLRKIQGKVSGTVMKKNVVSLIVVAAMLIAAGLIIVLDAPHQQADLSSVMELMGDAQKTAVKPLMMGTKVTAAEEMALGKKLVQNIYFRSSSQKSAEFKKTEEYVKRLGKSLLPSIQRKDIEYDFHLIEYDAINAFALPGGQIFVFTGLIDFVETEAELATILGHEITHVDAKHCIELFQAELAAKKIAGPVLDNFLGQIAARYATMVVTGGYRKFHEFEADAGGLKLAVQAGYEPAASEAVMNRLGQRFDRYHNSRKAKDPIAELSKSILVAADGYMRSHPPTVERVSRLQSLRVKMHDRSRKYYRGRENLKQRKVKESLRLVEEVVD